MQHAGDYGLKAAQISADIDAVVKRSRGVAKQLNQGVTHLMKKHKITVHMGTGKLTAPGKLEVAGEKGTETLTAKNIIVATGARARDLPFAPADGKRIWTYRHAMTPPEMPSKLLVIGSGAIGIEFASFYHDMGAKVTVVEMADRIMPVEDADISAFMAKALTRQGITIHTKTSAENIRLDADGITATISGTDTRFSHMIVAIGIVANSENLGLEQLGVSLDRGHVVTDAWGRTNVAGLWAIGDLTGAPWLAHKASHEGIVAVEKIAGLAHAHPMDKTNIPGCTYARPQVASVGLTEVKAREAGFEVRTGTFPFIGNGKAIALGEPEGFVKTVFDAATGALLGAHMVGAEVTEQIQGYVIARQCEATEAELMATIFPHPTISEAMHESVLAAYGRAIHI
jgi:dihydrolipoamide dehydrogenase